MCRRRDSYIFVKSEMHCGSRHCRYRADTSKRRRVRDGEGAIVNTQNASVIQSGLRLTSPPLQERFGGPLLRLCSGQATTREPRVLPDHFIRSKVFWRTSRSLGLPIFSRVFSIHFFSNEFFVGRSVS